MASNASGVLASPTILRIIDDSFRYSSLSVVTSTVTSRASDVDDNPAAMARMDPPACVPISRIRRAPDTRIRPARKK
jgi:hypothetical protein